ncbi:hypothetical protein ACIQFZ_39635 [Streptomyces sp. NPDC093064]
MGFGGARGHFGNQTAAVTFGPVHSVHFDIQVPSSRTGTSADEALLTLQALDGEIPGTSFAEGKLRPAPGTLIGAIQRGA